MVEFSGLDAFSPRFRFVRRTTPLSHQRRRSTFTVYLGVSPSFLCFSECATGFGLAFYDSTATKVLIDVLGSGRLLPFCCTFFAVSVSQGDWSRLEGRGTRRIPQPAAVAKRMEGRKGRRKARERKNEGTKVTHHPPKSWPKQACISPFSLTVGCLRLYSIFSFYSCIPWGNHLFLGAY